MDNRRTFLITVAGQVTTIATILAAWELIGGLSPSAFFLVATPSAVGSEFISLLLEGQLAYHFGVTGAEAITGMLLGTFIGSAIGLSFWYSDIGARIARPIFLALGSVPIFAFAPLMIVWFGIGFWMKVALAALSTVFVSIAQSFRGVSSVSGEYIEMAEGMDASRMQIFLKIVVPGSLNWIFSSTRLNVGFGLLGAFIGEFIASNAGLGYLILRASSLYNVPRALAASLGIVILAFVFDWAARVVERHSDLLVQIISVPALLWRK
jgi:NitT/TauT family transport system permease protein